MSSLASFVVMPTSPLIFRDSSNLFEAGNLVLALITALETPIHFSKLAVILKVNPGQRRSQRSTRSLWLLAQALFTSGMNIPQARPSWKTFKLAIIPQWSQSRCIRTAVLEGTYTYGTFCQSAAASL